MIKKKNGTFEGSLKKAQKAQSKKLKEWHRYMKENKPKEYYLKQYQTKRLKEVTGVDFKVKEPSCFDRYNKQIK